MLQVLESFLEEYRPAIADLPEELKPMSVTHGAHSFTKLVPGIGRVEVLLRQKAFKPKSSPSNKSIANSKSTLVRIVW